MFGHHCHCLCNTHFTNGLVDLWVLDMSGCLHLLLIWTEYIILFPVIYSSLLSSSRPKTNNLLYCTQQHNSKYYRVSQAYKIHSIDPSIHLSLHPSSVELSIQTNRECGAYLRGLVSQGGVRVHPSIHTSLHSSIHCRAQPQAHNVQLNATLPTTYVFELREETEGSMGRRCKHHAHRLQVQPEPPTL